MAKTGFKRNSVLQVEKYNGHTGNHVFVCSQASDSSADFSWPHMQPGSRNLSKPEVVITRQREDISTWSRRLRHSFRARPIHFRLRRHRLTMENNIKYKPEVETVLQTGRTNNWATETDINLNGYTPMFLGAVVHWFICQPSPMLHSRWSSSSR